MKNIEKYPSTQEALNAWTDYRTCGGVYPFEFWAHDECSDTRGNPLLSAAGAVVDAWRPRWGDMNEGNLERCLKQLYRVVYGIRKIPTEKPVDADGGGNMTGVDGGRPERTREDAETMVSRPNSGPFSGEPSLA